MDPSVREALTIAAQEARANASVWRAMSVSMRGEGSDTFAAAIVMGFAISWESYATRLESRILRES